MMNGPGVQTADDGEPERLWCVMGSACHPGPGSQDRDGGRGSWGRPLQPGFVGLACGCAQSIAVWCLLTGVTKGKGQRGSSGWNRWAMDPVLPALLCEASGRRWHVSWGASWAPGVRTFPSFSSKTNSAAGGGNQVCLTHCLHANCSNRSWYPIGGAMVFLMDNPRA